MADLNSSDVCPIHRRKDCCGREKKPSVKETQIWKRVAPGIVRNSIDGREKCSPAIKKQRKAQKLRQQDNKCAGCGAEFTDYRQIELDHIQAKGNGGAFRDDRLVNLQCLCNELLNNCHGKKTGLPQWSATNGNATSSTGAAIADHD